MGIAVLVFLLLIQVLAPAPVVLVRNAVFDGLQVLFPRERTAKPVVVVAIDERSLTALGQWPWPRSLTARLLRALRAAEPAAVGLDVLMPEADRSSPEIWAQSPELPPDLRVALARLPSHDRLLAQAIAAVPTVLGVAGLPAGMTASEAGGLPPVLVRGAIQPARLVSYGALLRSRPELDRAAAGQGLLSVERDADGVVRRLPLVVLAGGRLVPGLATEMLRQADGAAAVEVVAGPWGVEAVRVGRFNAPAATDGSAWLHFGPSEPDRFLSALDVLEGRADPGLLRGRLVLVGVTGLGLAVHSATPVEAAMSGVEIHAQMIEALAGGGLLLRPVWAPFAEAVLSLLLGAVFIGMLPVMPPRRYGVPALLLALPLPAAMAAFQAGLLLDGAVPTLVAMGVFAVMMVSLSVEGERQHRQLQRTLEEHRLLMAHLGGELAAERRATADRLQFIDMISHEYRTPLSVFRASLDILDMRNGNPDLNKPLSRMRRAVARLTEIVEVGLARARTDVSQIPVQRVLADLGVCLRDAVETCRLAHPQRSVNLVMPPSGPVIEADVPVLKTALLNVLDNALKYSDGDRPVMVRLDLANHGNSARLSIADQGIGMTGEELQRVFDQFYRAPRALTKPGTGMGLGIARRIIELHDGRIELHSELGLGTAVTINLPVKPVF